MQNYGRGQSSVALQPNDRLTLGLIGVGVIFASLGLGEAVYGVASRSSISMEQPIVFQSRCCSG
jgi:hypothetical protein